ncbi:MAG: 2-hydroxyacyl-CoA dehydratase [Deltaproteobacteria bacterium]|nr:2-hydroxyacyl-CoA dehydratase [Deltaproteobacteria bacterium]
MPSPLVTPFSEALNDYMKRLEAVSSKGKKIIGYFCTYTPIEIIHAAGFLPVRILGGTGQVDRAYSLAPNFICPPLLLSLDKALESRFNFLSGVVQAYTCDVACGIVNIWEENIGGEIYHTIPLPYNDSPGGKVFFRSAIEEMIEKLKMIGGNITEESLNNAISLYADIRRLVLRNMLERLLKDMKQVENHNPGGVPVLVSGSLVEEPRVLSILEESGGNIVADDMCTGYRHFCPPAGEGTDALECIIDRYIKRFPCPARTRAIHRMPLLMDLMQCSGARGVVFLFQKFCTPHLSDYPILREELSKEDVPNITVELEATGIMEGQLRTRFQAFIEMLEG